MKIAVSSTGKTIESKIEPAFGRCPFFLIIETKDNTVLNVEAVENRNAESIGMAGVSAVRLVAEKGAQAVITGRIGPRAMDALKQFRIKAYNGNGSAKNALKLLAKEKLERIC